MGCSGSHQNVVNKSSSTIGSLPSNPSKQSTIENDSLSQISPNIPRINLDDYVIQNLLATGGLGMVYSARHKQTNQILSLKFFGYVAKPVKLDELYHELELHAAINNINGIVQLYGVGLDSISGYIHNKVFPVSYPVICMEYLAGGDLFDRIQSRTSVSEKFIAKIIRDLVRTLDGLHQRGYLHCDLKLENVMFSTTDEDSQIKLIDFGMMIQLPSSGIYTSATVHGTPGYVAPESLTSGQYSTKSDIWQVGCILYCLLSGFQPFNPYNTTQTIHARFNKMTGVGWDHISSDVKDLITKIFIKNPGNRYTCQDILKHHWMRGNAPDEDLGESYHKRIKQLALGQTLKRVFQDHDIVQITKDTKNKLKRILPLLVQGKRIRRTRSNIVRPSHTSLVVASSSSTSSLPLPSSASSATATTASTQEAPKISSGSSHSSATTSPNSGRDSFKKTITRQERKSDVQGPLPHTIPAPYQMRYSQDDLDILRVMKENKSHLEHAQDTLPSSSEMELKDKITNLRTAFVHKIVANQQIEEQGGGGDGAVIPPEDNSAGKLDFDGFISLLMGCDLSELATPQMFHIFDQNKTGKIDLKEFLVTMVAFRDTTEQYHAQQSSFHLSSLKSPPLPPSSPTTITGGATTVATTTMISSPSSGLPPPPSSSPSFTPSASIEDNEEIIQFYFNMFDFDQSGSIGLDELKLVIRCICTDQSNAYVEYETPDERDIEAMFHTMAIKKNETIDYDEFKIFYNTLLVTSTTRSRNGTL